MKCSSWLAITELAERRGRKLTVSMPGGPSPNSAGAGTMGEPLADVDPPPGRRWNPWDIAISRVC